MVHRVGVLYVCPVAPLFKGNVMKVWVAMRFYQEESVFLGLGADKAAAKTFAPHSKTLDWQDGNDGKESTAMTSEHDGYKVFEEKVWR